MVFVSVQEEEEVAPRGLLLRSSPFIPININITVPIHKSFDGILNKPREQLGWVDELFVKCFDNDNITCVVG